MVAGGYAHAHVSICQPGIFGGNGDVGQQGNNQPCPDGRTVDGGDDGFGTAQHVVDEVAGFVEDAYDFVKVAVGIGHHLQVATGRKSTTRAGDNGRIHGRVTVNRLPQLYQFGVQTNVGGVKFFGAVKGYP